MEKLKLKHNHLLTNLLKVCIFSIVMLAPFFAVGIKCAYVSFNKNAYESYSDKKTMQTTLITDNSQVIEGNNYMINLKESGEGYSQYIYFNSSTIDFEYIAGTTLPYDPAGFRFYPNNTHLRIIDTNNNTYNYVLNNEKRTYLNGQSFNLKNGELYTSTQAVRFYMISYIPGDLDNAFYYAINQLHEEKIFNWAEHTGIYTAINGMTEGLEMGENNTLALLLSYWAICTAVYIVFDIVIVMFTKITHFIGEK